MELDRRDLPERSSTHRDQPISAPSHQTSFRELALRLFELDLPALQLLEGSLQAGVLVRQPHHALLSLSAEPSAPKALDHALVDRQSGELGTPAPTRLRPDVVQVRADRPDSDLEPPGSLLVSETLRDEGEYLPLPTRQGVHRCRGMRPAPVLEEQRRDVRCHVEGALGDAADRPQQLVGIRRLAEVSGGSGVQGLEYMI